MASSSKTTAYASEPLRLAAEARIKGDAIRTAIPHAGLPYPLTRGAEVGGEHCYSSFGAEDFQIRGPSYLTDKVKVAANPAIFDLMHVDMFLSNDKIGNVAARKDSWLRKARAAGDTRYYMVIVYVTPAAPFVHVVIYYAVNQEKVDALPHFKQMWQQFTSHGPEADSFRNDRWKVIPRVAEGSWVVQRAVGSKPALLAQKLTHTWVICDGSSNDPSLKRSSSTEGGAAAAAGGAGAGAAGAAAAASSSSSSSGAAAAAAAGSVKTADSGCEAGMSAAMRAHGQTIDVSSGPAPYIEADCDVASSSMAYMLVSLLQQYAKHIVIDLGFTIEPRAEEECPEVVMGVVRLSRMDVSLPPLIKAEPGDIVLGTTDVSHAAGAEEEEEGGQ